MFTVEADGTITGAAFTGSLGSTTSSARFTTGTCPSGRDLSACSCYPAGTRST